MTKAPKDRAQQQRERFIEAARVVGTDDDEKSFDRRLKTVAGTSSTGARKIKPPRARKK